MATAKKTVAKKPAAKKTVAKKPAAKKTAAKAPAAKATVAKNKEFRLVTDAQGQIKSIKEIK